MTANTEVPTNSALIMDMISTTSMFPLVGVVVVGAALLFSVIGVSVVGPVGNVEYIHLESNNCKEN